MPRASGRRRSWRQASAPRRADSGGVKHLVCGIAAAMLIGTGGLAAGADQAVAPPAGSSLVLELFADGVQIYTCDPKDGGGYGWSFNAPEAKLFDKDGRQVGTHFTGPAWELDGGSGVNGEVVAKADAPEPGAIQ